MLKVADFGNGLAVSSLADFSAHIRLFEPV